MPSEWIHDSSLVGRASTDALLCLVVGTPDNPGAGW